MSNLKSADTPCIVLIDANGRVGSEQSEAVGGYAPEAQNLGEWPHARPHAPPIALGPIHMATLCRGQGPRHVGQLKGDQAQDRLHP
eukprot:2428464-Alexandrium_andersonii.AAC.1